jgi:thiol-disulfide isomerase/thioredoxin
MIGRMILRVLLASFLMLLAACARQPAPVMEFMGNKDAVAFVFLAPDCPLSQSYSLTLNNLRQQFLANGIEFVGVFMTETGMSEFVATYKIAFPVHVDREFRLADYLGATVTPEVFVVDSSGKTVYRGAIDDGAPALGQHRTVITNNYLLDALNNVVHRKPIVPKQTSAVGCFIERKTGS